jgi:hypothetical protein
MLGGRGQPSESIAGSLALLSASVVLTVGAGEACLRLFPELLPEETQLRLHWQSTNDALSYGDPYLGHIFPPNHHGRLERDGGRERARRGERLFFEVDGRPNAAGYELMGMIVLDHLAEELNAAAGRLGMFRSEHVRRGSGFRSSRMRRLGHAGADRDGAGEARAAYRPGSEDGLMFGMTPPSRATGEKPEIIRHEPARMPGRDSAAEMAFAERGRLLRYRGVRGPHIKAASVGADCAGSRRRARASG